jgi:hypothetical protein
MSLDRKILDKIEKDKIGIIPRWVFVMKEAAGWMLACALLVVSSFALAGSFFIAQLSGWQFFRSTLSYAWLIIFVGLFAWGYQRIRQVGFAHMYKLSFAVIAVSILTADIVFGFAFYESGQVKKVELMLEEIPAYKNLLPLEENLIENDARKALDEKSANDDNNEIESGHEVSQNNEYENKDGKKDLNEKEKDNIESDLRKQEEARENLENKNKKDDDDELNEHVNEASMSKTKNEDLLNSDETDEINETDEGNEVNEAEDIKDEPESADIDEDEKNDPLVKGAEIKKSVELQGEEDVEEEAEIEQ